MTGPLRPARLDWSQGLPRSVEFGDVYFSRAGGPAESHHVFLAQNALPARFAGLAPHTPFTIVETGFGTGLNWLLTQALWRDCGAPGWLHFVSVESFPLTLADLRRAQSEWPALAAPAAALQARYPAPLPGFHRLVFPQWRSTLTLFFGDLADFLPRLAATADAWFLDGFAPDRNPEMWTEALYRGMAACSRAGATFATFTAAGRVRRGLAAAGFAVEKVPGFGHKREMLRGRFTGPGPAPAPGPAWLQRPAPAAGVRRACVVGAGIAGACTAQGLARRGWDVTVLERAQPAAGASGNPAAVLHPRLAPALDARDHFPQQAWLFALQELAQLDGPDRPWHPCGLLQLLTASPAGADRIPGTGLAGVVERVEAARASALAGVPLACDALWYPGAGWLDAPALCRRLLAQPGISLYTGTEVVDLQPAGGQWRLYGRDGLLLEAPVVILANAQAARRLPLLQDLPLQPVRGQVSLAPASPASARLRTVLCHDGYLTPPLPDGRHCLGATFLPDCEDDSVQTADHEANHALLQRALPGLAQALPPPATWQGRAALRCQSPDYLPLVGPVAAAADFRRAYAGLRDGKVRGYPELPALPGLYVNLAHGSRGFAQAALAAEILAAELGGEPYPVSRRVLEALHPLRFWARALKRREW